MSRCICFACCLVLVSFLDINKSYAQVPDQGKSKVSIQSQLTPNQPPRFVDPFEGFEQHQVQRVMIVWYKKTAQEANFLARQLSRQYAKKADIALFEWDISLEDDARRSVVSDPAVPTDSSDNPFSLMLTGLKHEGGPIESAAIEFYSREKLSPDTVLLQGVQIASDGAVVDAGGVTPVTPLVPIRSVDRFAMMEQLFSMAKQVKTVDNKPTRQEAQIEPKPDNTERVVILYYNKEAKSEWQEKVFLSAAFFHMHRNLLAIGGKNPGPELQVFKWDLSDSNAPLEGIGKSDFALSLQRQAHDFHASMRIAYAASNLPRDTVLLAVYTLSSARGVLCDNGVRLLQVAHVDKGEEDNLQQTLELIASGDFVNGQFVSHSTEKEGWLPWLSHNGSTVLLAICWTVFIIVLLVGVVRIAKEFSSVDGRSANRSQMPQPYSPPAPRRESDHPPSRPQVGFSYQHREDEPDDDEDDFDPRGNPWNDLGNEEGEGGE